MFGRQQNREEQRENERRKALHMCVNGGALHGVDKRERESY